MLDDSDNSTRTNRNLEIVSVFYSKPNRHLFRYYGSVSILHLKFIWSFLFSSCSFVTIMLSMKETLFWWFCWGLIVKWSMAQKLGFFWINSTLYFLTWQDQSVWSCCSILNNCIEFNPALKIEKVGKKNAGACDYVWMHVLFFSKLELF